MLDFSKGKKMHGKKNIKLKAKKDDLARTRTGDSHKTSYISTGSGMGVMAFTTRSYYPSLEGVLYQPFLLQNARGKKDQIESKKR
jgi:hypothetical protein